MSGERSANTKRSHLRILGLAVFISFLVGSTVVFADYFAVAPHGSDFLKTAIVSLGFPFLASVVIVPVALLFCVSRRLRRTALQAALSCGVFAATFLASIRIGNDVRMDAFRALAERSAPLVEAIKAYERKYGEPPPNLDSIVPEFLRSMPTTGMAAYPEYGYFVGKPKMYDGNPWVLQVFSPSGILNFDRFLYYPLQNYDSWCGDPLEPLGDWAYLHE